MEKIAIDSYEGKNKHVDASINEGQFMDASRTFVFAATTKENTLNEMTSFKKVGLIQSYGWSENKEVSQVYELGSNIAYMVPGRTNGAISIARILISGKDLLNAIVYGDEEISDDEFLKSLGDTTAPIHLMFANFANSSEGESGGLVYSRIFANCHITSRRESIGAGQRIIMENASLIYSYILKASVTEK